MGKMKEERIDLLNEVVDKVFNYTVDVLTTTNELILQMLGKDNLLREYNIIARNYRCKNCTSDYKVEQLETTTDLTEQECELVDSMVTDRLKKYIEENY